MALRPVKGVLAVEGTQTGDGRLIAEGALEWADLPLPLAWLRDGDQHISLSEVGPQIGVIETITRVGNALEFTGGVDDENPDGAEVIRRLEGGTAPLGKRFGVSIDPDDYEVEIVMTEPGEGEDVVIVASGRMAKTLAAVRRNDLVAAAGDPDPGGEVLFEDSADGIIERYTRMRIRGATLCSVAAFAEAFVELAGAAAVTAAMPGMPEHGFEDPSGDGFCDFCVTSDDAGDCTMQCGMTEAMHSMVNEGVAAAASDGAAGEASAVAASAPVRPPLAWFQMPEPEIGSDLLVEQPDGSMACPLTITDEGQVFGHAAGPGCHTGYLDRCVLAPDSPTGYARYNLFYVECDDGTKVNTGPLVVGCDHADLSLFAPGARDHYANAGLAWADARAVQGVFGPWVCGALRPEVTPEQVRVLRASGLSGDWRDEGMGLDMIAVLTVNGPGFPILREAMAASGLPPVAKATGPRVRYVDGKRTALVAAGVVHRCPECAERERIAAAAQLNGQDFAEMRAMLQRIDRRTKALIPQAMAASAARIRGES